MIFFSYGTLLDAEYQAALFGRAVPTTPARLHGWRAVFTASGFLTIVRDPDGTVDGALVRVDERELAICDAWEEVPLYERTPVTVICDGANVDTWAYVRDVPDGDPAPPGMLARADRAGVLRAIHDFRAGRAGGHTG